MQHVPGAEFKNRVTVWQTEKGAAEAGVSTRVGADIECWHTEHGVWTPSGASNLKRNRSGSTRGKSRAHLIKSNFVPPALGVRLMSSQLLVLLLWFVCLRGLDYPGIALFSRYTLP